MSETLTPIAESKNFIVLDAYKRIESAAKGYQSEDDLERELVRDLVDQGYEFRPDIASTQAMLAVPSRMIT